MPWLSTGCVNIGQFAIETEIVPMKKANQDHSATIVTTAEMGTTPVWDGLVIGRSEVGRIFSADCVPLVLIGKHKAIAVHISRKNILGMLVSIRTLLPQLSPAFAYIGPHICGDHFTFSTVGAELEALRRGAYPIVKKDSRGVIHVDLAAGVNRFLREIGISSAAVFSDSRCTYETTSLPSYRRCYDTGAAWTETLCTTVSSFEQGV